MWTPTDEVVVPNLGPAPSSALSQATGGRRATISTFDVCPGHVADHLSMGTFDAVAYALVVDALEHDGPARPSRVDRAACLAPLHEGVDPVTFRPASRPSPPASAPRWRSTRTSSPSPSSRRTRWVPPGM